MKNILKAFYSRTYQFIRIHVKSLNDGVLLYEIAHWYTDAYNTITHYYLLCMNFMHVAHLLCYSLWARTHAHTHTHNHINNNNSNSIVIQWPKMHWIDRFYSLWFDELSLSSLTHTHRSQFVCRPANDVDKKFYSKLSYSQAKFNFIVLLFFLSLFFACVSLTQIFFFSSFQYFLLFIFIFVFCRCFALLFVYVFSSFISL